MKGFFITFEGIEGTGKSTQAKALHKNLKEEGYPTIFTREPGGTKIGNLIREILIDPENREMNVIAEIFLFAAARSQHVEQVLRPSIEEGFVVVCDRFADSSVAYQGYGRDIPLALIREINSTATWRIQPDLTFYLDLEPEIALHRVKMRVEEMENIPDRLEREKLDFFHKVRNGYKRIAEDESHRFRVLDAKMEPAVLNEKITELCIQKIRKAGIIPGKPVKSTEDWELEGSLGFIRGEKSENKRYRKKRLQAE